LVPAAEIRITAQRDSAPFTLQFKEQHMSWQEAEQPNTKDSPCNPVATVIIPRARDIGEFTVRRALPAQARQSVGPFVFFDQMGPATFGPNQALDVRPHPHIGLSTITWLFEGEIRHKDSLGRDLVIRPGEVNWMTAGRGIVHSERSPESQRKAGARLSGIQSWVALPTAQEEREPSFQHYTSDLIPRMNDTGVALALIVGSGFGKSSPVVTASPTLYAELRLDQGHTFQFPVLAEEQAVYVAEGAVEIAGSEFKEGSLAVLKPEMAAQLHALSDSRCMLLGGDALDGPRILWWNFVASNRERLEQAKDDWRNGRFAMVAGDPEFIPLPER
jgi:redox-sensitive bicupin YhaK (pirin superfamily)